MIIDIDRGGRLRRQFAAGPRGRPGRPLARRGARASIPTRSRCPAQVHSSGKSILLAHADDPGVLGTGPGGTPLLMTLGATSLICVPISDGTTGYGAMTLARQAGRGPFEVADLGLAEELGEHLAIAIRVDRMFRHRSEVAEALQASLLPARLPDGARARVRRGLHRRHASRRRSAVTSTTCSRYRDGWAIAIGDVCGKGQDAAAMTAAARHSIRALAHVHDAPADVLAAANEVLVAGDYGERFVTASLAFLRQRGRRRAGAARPAAATRAPPSSGPTGGWRSWRATGCRSGCSATPSPARRSWSSARATCCSSTPTG